MGEYYRTPPMGQHFAIRWAKEDLELERNKVGHNRPHFTVLTSLWPGR